MLSSQTGTGPPLDARPPPPPPALLPGEAERDLTPRQREILDALEALAVEGGIAALPMAQLAKRVNCSLRTLYGLAPHKDELLLIVIDRRLHRIGRAALRAMETRSDPIDALRAYLEVAHLAVGTSREALDRELELLPGAVPLFDAHSRWMIAVTELLLGRAVQAGRIEAVDTTALALVLGGLGSFYSHPRILPHIQGSPKEAAGAIMEIILRGLASPVAPD